MKLFRITDPKYAQSDDLRDHAGGSFAYDGRWHDRQEMLREGGLLYTGASASLCATEKQVHSTPQQLRQHEFALITYEATIDPDLTTIILASGLPPNWNDPLGCDACRGAGSDWYAGGVDAFLIVPSATLPASAYDPEPPGEMRNGNVLINTRHHEVARLVRKVSISPFRYDQRLSHP